MSSKDKVNNQVFPVFRISNFTRTAANSLAMLFENIGTMRFDFRGCLNKIFIFIEV